MDYCVLNSESEILRGSFVVIHVSVHWGSIVSLNFNSGDIVFWEMEVEIKQNTTVTKV